MEYIGAEPADRRPLAIPKLDVKKIGSLAEFSAEGYAAFSLSPLYSYARVDESILERFAAENIKGLPPKVEGGTINCEHPIVARCEGWNNQLHFLDNISWGLFQDWMQIQTFLNRELKDVFVPRQYAAPVLDPFALTRGDKIPVTLPVFTVSGTKYRLRPLGNVQDKTQTKFFIDFERVEPEPVVVNMAKAMLDMTGD